MVIYFQDWINFIPTIFAFLICVLVACEGSVLKKLTIGLMVASTVFSFNSLNDNFIGFHDWRVVLFKMLFLGAMFLGVRQFAPERGVRAFRADVETFAAPDGYTHWDCEQCCTSREEILGHGRWRETFATGTFTSGFVFFYWTFVDSHRIDWAAETRVGEHGR